MTEHREPLTKPHRDNDPTIPRTVLVTIGYDGAGRPVQEVVPIDNAGHWDQKRWRARP